MSAENDSSSPASLKDKQVLVMHRLLDVSNKDKPSPQQKSKVTNINIKRDLCKIH